MTRLVMRTLLLSLLVVAPLGAQEPIAAVRGPLGHALAVRAVPGEGGPVDVSLDSAGARGPLLFRLTPGVARTWANQLAAVVRAPADSGGTRRLTETDTTTRAVGLLVARTRPADTRSPYTLVIELPDGAMGDDATLLGADVVELARGLRAGAEVVDGIRTPERAGPVFFEFQVERPVTAMGGSCSPRYPESLRQEHVTGESQLQFVVDVEGKVELESVKVLRATHPLFTQAVVQALPCMRFEPASIRGKRVRQIVQQPFVFDIRR